MNNMPIDLHHNQSSAILNEEDFIVTYFLFLISLYLQLHYNKMLIYVSSLQASIENPL